MTKIIFPNLETLFIALILALAATLIDWNFNKLCINAEPNNNTAKNGTNEAKFITGVQCRFYEHNCKVSVRDDASTKECCVGNTTCKRYKPFPRDSGENVCVVKSRAMEKKVKDCCVGIGEKRCSVYYGHNINVKEEVMDLYMRKSCS